MGHTAFKVTKEWVDTVADTANKDMADTPSQNIVDIPSQNTPNQNTPSQNMVDTPSHHTEVTQDRRMDNLWVTMAHPPMANPVLPKVTMAHVILKATMALPLNKDRRNLKIKLVQNKFI